MEDIIQKRLIVVSNRLPFQLVEKNNKVSLRESDGGLVSALKSYFDKPDIQEIFQTKWWIGSADFPEKRWEKYKSQENSTTPFAVEPLFIEKKTYNKYYNGFCNATIWPLFPLLSLICRI